MITQAKEITEIALLRDSNGPGLERQLRNRAERAIEYMAGQSHSCGRQLVSQASNEIEVLRLIVYSHNPKLQNLLSATLGKEFVVESDQEKIKHEISKRSADVLILDLDSSYCSIRDQLSLFDGISMVVM